MSNIVKHKKKTEVVHVKAHRRSGAMELYKRVRPSTFERVSGCVQTAMMLANAVERGEVPHTVLFHGPSGTGKTTMARILKDELGCHDADFQEMNSASYRGIDSVRAIIAQMNLAPLVGDCRIWLLDECHQISKDGQSALLKALEDTPEHVYFFLCTTEPLKLLPALRGRCTEAATRSLTWDESAALVRQTCKRERLEIPDAMVNELATAADGSARKLLVFLDAICRLDASEQLAVLALKRDEENVAIDLCRALIDRKPWGTVAKVLLNLKEDPESVRRAVLGYARAVLLNGAGEKAVRAYEIIDCFGNNYYDSGSAGLAHNCFEALVATAR